MLSSLEGKILAFWVCLNKDGSPQVTPTWIDIIEKEENEVGREEIILINTAMDCQNKRTYQETHEYQFQWLMKIIRIVW